VGQHRVTGREGNPARQHHFPSMLIAVRHSLRHANVMGQRKPIDRTAPDLFTTETASALPATEEATKGEPRRYVLPKNLRNAVKHLSDGELDLMHAATLEELKRRGKTPKSVETDLPARPVLTNIQSPPTEKRRHVDIAAVPLTRGQVNAVRAAFKAGITHHGSPDSSGFPNPMRGRHWHRMNRGAKPYDDQIAS